MPLQPTIVPLPKQRAHALTPRMWRQMLADCDARQRSYDAEQSRQLMRQPFMQRAREGAGKS